MDQIERENLELRFWENDASERPEADSIENILNKTSEAGTFWSLLQRHEKSFATERILELGGGQCWASCLVKRFRPQARIVASDISPAAVASLPKWERVWGVSIDERFACRSYEIPLPDASVNTVFAFAAAHHFGRQSATLHELQRVLSPGGRALYLYEPTSSDWLYRRAVVRANAVRPIVPEDVLRWRKLEELAHTAGLQMTIEFNTPTTFRSLKSLIYWRTIEAIPALQRSLISSANLLFQKPLA